MHEVALMQGVVATVQEQAQAAGATKVTQINLTIGAASHFTEEIARQHFETLAAGTVAEEATLHITWLPATYQCFTCLHQFQSAEPLETIICPRCGGVALEIAHRDVCQVDSLEIVRAGQQPQHLDASYETTPRV